MRVTPILRRCALFLSFAIVAVFPAGCGNESSTAVTAACRSSKSVQLCVRSLPPKFEWTGQTQAIKYEVTLKPLGREDQFQLVQVPPVYSDADGAMILPDHLAVGSGAVIRPSNPRASSTASSGVTAASGPSSASPMPDESGGAVPSDSSSATAASEVSGSRPEVNVIGGAVLSDKQTSEIEPGECAFSEPNASHSTTSRWRRTTTLRLFHGAPLRMRYRHEISKARPWPGADYSSKFMVRPIRSSEPWLIVTSPTIRVLGATGVRLQLTQTEPPTGIDWASMKKLLGRRLVVRGRIDAAGSPDVILRFWGVTSRGNVLEKELSRVRPSADGTFVDEVTGLPSVKYGEIRALANVAGRLEYATCPRVFWSAGKSATPRELYDAIRHR